MPWLEILVMAVLQGSTELFPVSSLGHAVVVQGWFGWARDPAFLAFLVLLHFGTAAALLAYFWKDWVGLLAALGPGKESDARRARRLVALIVVATIPAVIIGWKLRGPLSELFGNPIAAAIFLIANAALLYFGDRPQAVKKTDLAAMTYRQSLIIGFLQCLAFLPGISRSGATIVGGLWIGLSDAEAAHFSFLMATPVIAAAGVKELPALFHGASGQFGPLLIGAVLSALIAYASIALLMRYFRSHNLNALRPFAGYCLALGVISLIYFAL